MTWLIAVGVAAVGVVAFQIGLIAPKETRTIAMLLGGITLVVCCGAAFLLADLSRSQASSISGSLSD